MSTDSVKESLGGEKIGHPHGHPLIGIVYILIVLHQTALQLEPDPALIDLCMKDLEYLLELDLLKNVLTLKVQSRSGHQFDHFLGPSDLVRAHVDTVPQISLLGARLDVVEDAQRIAAMLFILNGVLGPWDLEILGTLIRGG